MELSRQEYRSGLPFPYALIFLICLANLFFCFFFSLLISIWRVCLSNASFLCKSIFKSCFCCCSVAQSCLTLCDPMDCSTPGSSVLHYLLEFAQTHVHWAGDAIQPSHPLLPSSPPALHLSQHQDLFQWVCSLHQVAKYCSFSSRTSPSNEYSGLTSFRND